MVRIINTQTLKEKLVELKLLEPMLSPIFFAALTLLFISTIFSNHIINNYVEYAYSPVNPEKDDRYHMTNLLESSSKKRTVYNLGGSSLLRAIEEGHNLEKLWDNEVEFKTFAYPSQTLLESFIILNKLSIKKDDLVVLHVSMTRINKVLPDIRRMCNPYLYTLQLNDLMSTIKALDIEKPKLSIFCQITLFTKHEIIRNILINITQNKKDFVYQGIYPDEYSTNPLSLQKIRTERINSHKQKSFAKYALEFTEDKAEKNLEIILKINELLRSKDAKLILISTPQNLEWYKRHLPNADQVFSNRYNNLYNTTKEHGINYYDLRRLQGFKFENFYDHLHMLQSGRDIFSPTYYKLISDELNSEPN